MNKSNDEIVEEFDRMFPQFVELHRSHTDGTTEIIHATNWLDTILATKDQEKADMVRERVPENMVRITINARIGNELLTTEKMTSLLAIEASDGRTLLLESESAAYEMLNAVAAKYGVTLDTNN